MQKAVCVSPDTQGHLPDLNNLLEKGYKVVSMMPFCPAMSNAIHDGRDSGAMLVIVEM